MTNTTIRFLNLRGPESSSIEIPPFYILGQKSVKFFVGFLENSERHSEIN